MKLKINKAFAATYDERRRKEELSRLKSKYGDVSVGDDDDESDEESSSSDSDIDEENILTDTRELDVLNALISDDPRIRDPEFKWYSSSDDEETKDEGSSNVDEKVKETQRQPDNKQVFLRDVERLRLLKNKKSKKGYVEEEINEEEEEQDDLEPNELLHLQPDLMELKKAFKKAAQLDENSGNESLFTLVTKKTNDCISSSDVVINQNKSKDELLLKYIARISANANEPKTNYRFASDSDSGSEDESEKEVEEEDNEEEEDSDSTEESSDEIFVQRSQQKEVRSHPRAISDSMRIAGDGKKKRSEKNREVRERKRQEKEAKKAKIELDLHKKVESELQEFKRLKKEAANDRIEQIKRTAATSECQLDAKDLEDDWDPEKHEQMVQRLFGDEYDTAEVEDSKPVFSDDEELDKDLVDWDQWNTNVDSVDAETSAFDPGYEAVEEAGTSQAVEEGRGAGSRRRRRRRRLAGFRRALERVSTPGNANCDTGRYRKEDFPEGFDAFIDKVYELDCEDVILGRGEGQEDIKCRFKYRTVEPNDYGLSAEEVLSAPAKELNSWISLKRITQIRSKDEEERDKRLYSSQRRQGQKGRLIPTVFVPVAGDEEGTQEKPTSTNSNPTKKKRKKKNKGKKRTIGEQDEASTGETSMNDNGEEKKQKSKKRRIQREFDRVPDSRISKLVRNSK